MSNLIIEKKSDLNINLQTAPKIRLPTNVLMVTPTYFNIDTPINAHMLDEHGKPHQLDKNKALAQWTELKKTYEKLNLKVSILEGVEGLPDMVFCANQSFPFMDKDQKRNAFLSNMHNDIRHKEVEHIGKFLSAQGYATKPIASRNKNTLFEGMGDVTWLSRTKFLLGGYGFRTSKDMYIELSKVTETPIAIFELKNPKFYHLDTCLSVLNETTAIVCKEAFTQEGYELLQSIFKNLLEVPLLEADAPGFACNAHCPDEKHIIIQRGNNHTVALTRQYGFIPIEVDTSEFIKSGGSVYCMKLMYF